MALFIKQIDADIRDLDHTFNGSSWSSSLFALSLGDPGVVTRNIGLRFTGVTIAPGSTVNSAIIRLTAGSTRSSQVIKIRIFGVDEDNTGEFVVSPEDSARTRTQTTAFTDWDVTISTTNGNTFDTADFTAIVQEIVDRGGWSSGNAMAFFLGDNGSTSGDYVDNTDYNGTPSESAELRIDFTPPGSPSPSATPSSSPSLSPSSSASPSSSVSISPSASNSPSPSPSPGIPFHGLLIAKSGKNPLETNNPNDFIFNSDFGTLKYFDKQVLEVSFDANIGDITGKATFNHGLGYYPFVEVFVRAYIGSPAGNYEYCPFFGAGATILYHANYKITEDDIIVYGEINGVSTSVWNFDFLVFIYKNDLKLN